MNVVVNSQILAEQLRAIVKVVPTKAALPILLNVRLDAKESSLTFYGTDFEIGLRTQCEAEVKAPGSITLHAKKFLDLIERMNDSNVALSLDKATLHVTCGAFKSKLQTLPASDFPEIPEIEGEVVALRATTLQSMIEKVSYAMSKEEARYFLNGSLLSFKKNVMALVATDGKRLSLATNANDNGADSDTIIPSKTLKLLTLHQYDQFSQSDKHLFFQNKERLLISRKLDGNFPKYERIIPRDNKHIAVINRTMLAAAIRRVSVTTDEETFAMSITLSENLLSLNAKSAGLGTSDEELPITYTGPTLKINFAWDYVIDFLEAATSETITLMLKDGNNGMLFMDGDNFLNVVMPIRD